MTPQEKAAFISAQTQMMINERELMADDGTLLKSTGLLSSPQNHLIVLHRVLYGTIDEGIALRYLHHHLREDADLADMGRPLKYQYQANVRDEVSTPGSGSSQTEAGSEGTHPAPRPAGCVTEREEVR